MKLSKFIIFFLITLLTFFPLKPVIAQVEPISTPVSFPSESEEIIETDELPPEEEVSESTVAETEFEKLRRNYKDIDESKYNKAKSKTEAELTKKHHDDFLIVKFKNKD